MKRLDIKHIAYHVLVALYIIWFLVFGTLITIGSVQAFSSIDNDLSKILTLWIFFNLVMGTVLFFVIRLFRNSNLLARIILYSYYFIAIASVIAVFIISTQ